MNTKIQKVLKKIEANGFEAYVVGGYVRDLILGLETTDVDICTNALPKDIMRIFNITTNHSYGSISFTNGKYSFDITTYRSEESYNKRKPLEVTYVDNLITDLKRRDFTINSLCMNSEGTLIDLLGGQADIKARVIRVIGDAHKKLTEDPLRILRAIRFSITLDFALDVEITDFIEKHRELIGGLSYYRKQEEINRIISSKKAKVGLSVLKNLGLLPVLEIDYHDIVIVNDILGIWAQMEYSSNYSFTRSSLQTIMNIRKILESRIIDNLTLFNYDLYVTTVAGEILGYSRKDIAKRYANLPVKSAKDLAINSADIFKILDLKPSPQVKVILNDLIAQVLNHNLENQPDDLEKYLISRWK